MLNIIKSDFLKLKAYKPFFYSLFWSIVLWTWLFSLIFLSENYSHIKAYNMFFSLEWNLNMHISLCLYFFVIGFIIDMIVGIDKANWILLYSKNHRAKYFLSKIIISLYFVFLILTLSLWIATVLLFSSYDGVSSSMIFQLLQETIFMIIKFMILITPIVVLMVLISLMWIKSIIIWIGIWFFWILSLLWILSSSNPKIQKVFDTINHSFIFDYAHYSIPENLKKEHEHELLLTQEFKKVVEERENLLKDEEFIKRKDIWILMNYSLMYPDIFENLKKHVNGTFEYKPKYNTDYYTYDTSDFFYWEVLQGKSIEELNKISEKYKSFYDPETKRYPSILIVFHMMNLLNPDLNEAKINELEKHIKHLFVKYWSWSQVSNPLDIELKIYDKVQDSNITYSYKVPSMTYTTYFANSHKIFLDYFSKNYDSLIILIWTLIVWSIYMRRRQILS